MSTRKLTISFFAAALLLAGGSAHAAKADAETAISDIKPGHAQIVFLRRTTVNALASTIIYDVTSGEPKAVGKITNSRKLIVDIPPGEYRFMVGHPGMQDFMPTTVLADKRYYVVVNAIWPAWFSSWASCGRSCGATCSGPTASGSRPGLSTPSSSACSSSSA